MSSSFVPKGQEGLLLRSPLMYGFYPHDDVLYPKPIYTKDFDKSHVLGKKDQQVLMKHPQKLSFYTRNNPHPGRVCHMKGLLDVPICSVEDQAAPRYLLSPPSGQDFRQGGFMPKGSTRYSANISKMIPAIGVVPVTNAWRDELEKKTQDAILRAMGQPLPSRGGSIDSQSGMRKERMFDNLQDEKLLEWLCRILQTESIAACLAWLSTASETEKMIVLNMIKMVACGEIQDPSFPPRPHTSDSQVRYVWAPQRSQITKHTHRHGNTEGHIDMHQPQEDGYGGLAEGAIEDAPFKLPDNDTIIRTAHQLSRLASRNSARSLEGGKNGPAMEKARDENLNKKIGKQLKEYATQGKRQRSASLSLPKQSSVGLGGAAPKRSRSRSVTSGIKDRLPPVRGPGPVNVSVTKEKIQGGGAGGGGGSGSARLRYTSHWET